MKILLFLFKGELGFGKETYAFKAIAIGPLITLAAPFFGAKPTRKIGAMELAEAVEAVAEKGYAYLIASCRKFGLCGKGRQTAHSGRRYPHIRCNGILLHHSSLDQPCILAAVPFLYGGRTVVVFPRDKAG